MSAQPRFGVVVGLTAEARIAAGFGCPVRAGGGTPAGAGVAAAELAAAGVRGLVSFGLAGGLNPALRPGDLVVATAVVSDGDVLPTDPALSAAFAASSVNRPACDTASGHRILAWHTVIADAARKQALYRSTGADAVDLESGAVARVAGAYNLPFAVVRAICDPAERALPEAALIALDAEGRIAIRAVLRSVLRRPGQIPGLIHLGRDASRARRALLRTVEAYRRGSAPGPRLSAAGGIARDG